MTPLSWLPHLQQSVSKITSTLRYGALFLLITVVLASGCQQVPSTDNVSTYNVATASPPNIIFMLVDDLRWDELGYSGSKTPTPNIDMLATNGVRFNNAFVTSSLCSPSRASFLTGLYPHSHGVTGNTSDLDYKTTPTLASMLQGAGYRTALIGKWHMGDDPGPRPGYEYWFAMPGQGSYTNPIFNDNGSNIQLTDYNSDILTAKAIEFISQPNDRPFFLHLAYKAVHTPFEPAPRHQGALQDTDFKHQKRPSAYFAMEDQRRQRARIILSIDESLHEIYAHLEKSGLLNNTIIVFTSDNGYLFGEHDLGDKRWFFEESIRIPWLVYYPPLTANGRALDQPVLNIDLMPSLLELAHVPTPASVEGRSFIPLLTAAPGEHTDWRENWVYEYFNEVQYMNTPTQLALVDSQFKFVRFPEGPDLFGRVTGEDLLFDLKADPYELNNVAEQPLYSEVVARMDKQLREFMATPGFRFFPLDPDQVNQRMGELYKDPSAAWFKAAMDKLYPNGYPGWKAAVPATP